MISDKHATHVVTHPFDAAGRVLANGDRVDASAWRNTDKLVATKMLRPIGLADQRLPAVDSPKKLAPKPVLKKFTLKRK